MSNVLDLLDQSVFDVGRATGSTSTLQAFWVYHRSVDLDVLRRFHGHLQRGRLSRSIERSPLPFGRHRWTALAESCGLEIAAATRPREELESWLDEQARRPLDCEHGPGWRLAVLPFADGGAGVSVVVSHCLTDGIGLCEALADAALGRNDPIDWPAPASRRRWPALREDAGQAFRDLPAVRRAVAAAITTSRRARVSAGAPPAAAAAVHADPGERVELPIATVFVDAGEWKARAQELGGTSNALMVGVAARFAERAGRAAADGSVVVMVPVNRRVAGDTRANAINNVGVTVEHPGQASTGLREIKAAVWHALVRHREVGDQEESVNAIVPLLPRRLLKGASAGRNVVAPHVVGSSNLGAVGRPACRPDGTDADYFAIRNTFLGVAKATMERRGGMQAMLSGRTHRHVFISVIDHHPGRPDSDAALRRRMSDTLADFSLTGTFMLAGSPL